MKKALVIGATGMVGEALLQQLLQSESFSHVSIFVRKSTGIVHAKLTEWVVDFDEPTLWEQLVQGDVLFSCMGTTLKAAGSKQAQYRVDFSYQYSMARIAARNGVTHYVLVSSAGANAGSSNFYLSMKGELDNAVKALPFTKCVIIRPGQLYGNRRQKRVFESIAIDLMMFFNRVGLFKKYRPIHATQVAQAMIHTAVSEKEGIFTLDELFDLCSN